MNKVVLIGRLVKDPELKFIPGTGTPTASVTIAVDRWNRQTQQNEADFIPLIFWNKQAENIANYCQKGSQIAVAGKMQTRSYDAKDGTKRYVTEVVVNDLQFLNKAKSSGQSLNGFTEEENNGDIPF